MSPERADFAPDDPRLLMFDVTRVELLELKPGDRLIIHTPRILSDQETYELAERFRVYANIPKDIPIIPLPPGFALERIREEDA
jgi:hypothetical protein